MTMSVTKRVTMSVTKGMTMSMTMRMTMSIIMSVTMGIIMSATMSMTMNIDVCDWTFFELRTMSQKQQPQIYTASFRSVNIISLDILIN